MFNIDLNQLLIGILGSLIAAGITALILRLSKLKPIQVPIWVFVGFSALFIILGYLQYQSQNTEQTTVHKKNFGVESVVMDGKHFVECSFDRSEMVFRGTKPFSLTHCNGSGATFKFEGNAAMTMQVLNKLYRDPGTNMYAEDAIRVITNNSLHTDPHILPEK